MLPVVVVAVVVVAVVLLLATWNDDEYQLLLRALQCTLYWRRYAAKMVSLCGCSQCGSSTWPLSPSPPQHLISRSGNDGGFVRACCQPLCLPRPPCTVTSHHPSTSYARAHPSPGCLNRASVSVRVRVCARAIVARATFSQPPPRRWCVFECCAVHRIRSSTPARNSRACAVRSP